MIHNELGDGVYLDGIKRRMRKSDCEKRLPGRQLLGGAILG